MNRRTRLSLLTATALLACVGLDVRTASAAPITFTTLDYDNTANTVGAGPTPVNNQTTGLFRDVTWYSLNNGQPRLNSPDFINQGNSLVLSSNHAVPGSGPYTALNFTGPAVSGGQSYLSIYDKTPGDGSVTKNVFDATVAGGLTVSADVLFVKHSSSGGVVALYSAGQDALALLASNGDGNNHDFPKLSLVFQSAGQGVDGTPGGRVELTSVDLPANTFVAASWYRVTMNLVVSGDSWTMNGTFTNHATASDPTSALGSVITTLVYTGSLLNSDPTALRLTNPGEIGILAMANEGISLPDNVGVSVTNFAFSSQTINSEVPEPASFVLLGSAVPGLFWAYRRRRSARVI